MAEATGTHVRQTPLYTEEQFSRRNETVWTAVQGILAPLQFLAFLVSLVLVVRYMMTGVGYEVATASILIKTGLLYTIMLTGAIWEKIVFGQYLFAPAFFWEDLVSFAVIGLHTAYVLMLWQGTFTSDTLIWTALAAYAVYVINAGQFLWKLRLARRDAEQRI